MKNTEPLVSICCITYNHAPYIRQCLDGFLMQKTDFAFEVLIHDDASTDGTTEIIKEYENKFPDIIKPLYEEENQWIKGRRGSAVFNFPRARGKYIAMCEGDDYWIDPLKLQKQVDFMEDNQDYSMVFTDVIDYFQETGKYGERHSLKYGNINKRLCNSINGAFLSIIMGECRIQTLSVLFRLESRPIHINLPNFMMGDTSLWLDLSQNGKIGYIEDCTGVYRKSRPSITNNKNLLYQFSLSMYEMRLYYCYKYNYAVPQRIRSLYNRYYVLCKIFSPCIKALYPLFQMNKIQMIYAQSLIASRRYTIGAKVLFRLEDILFYFKSKYIK